MKRLEQFDVFDIPCKDIFYDHDFNCRDAFTLESVRELADSIRDRGLDFPVIVQPAAEVPGIPPGYLYRLVVGHRRFVAHTDILKRDTIRSSIRSGLTEEEAASLNFVENLERKDLNVLEQAQAMAKRGLSYRQLEKVLHKDCNWVQRRMILLRQPDEIQQMAASGRLSLTDVQYLINPLATDEEKCQVARRITTTPEAQKEARRRYSMARRPRTRQEIDEKIAYMLELGLYDVVPVVTRFAAWVAKGITDEEMDKDLREFVNQNGK
jgi:ParB family chromosome partitioning protein